MAVSKYPDACRAVSALIARRATRPRGCRQAERLHVPLPYLSDTDIWTLRMFVRQVTVSTRHRLRVGLGLDRPARDLRVVLDPDRAVEHRSDLADRQPKP